MNVSLVLTLIVTFAMADRYMQSESNIALGVVMLSVFMIAFYLYKIFLSADVGSTAHREYKRND